MDPDSLIDDRMHLVPDWIWETDVEGIFRYTNRVVEDVLGYAPAQVLGISLFDLMAPDDRSRCRGLFEEARTTRQPIRNVVGRFVAADASVRALESSCIPIIDEADQLLGFRGISRDVTEREELRVAAEEALEHYRAVVENSPTGIFIVQDGAVVFANQTIADQMGYSREEAIGLDIWRFVHPEDKDWLADYYRGRLMGEDVPTQYVARGITSAGDVRYFDFRATLIQHNGRPAVLLNAVDITDRRQAEIDLNARTEELEAILHAFPDIYFWLDADGAIVDYHATAQSDLYVPPEQFMHRRCTDVLPAEAARPISEALDRVLATGEHESVEYMLPVGGEDKYFEGRLIALENRRVLVIVRDITERRRDENRLRSLNEAMLSLGVDPGENIRTLTALCGRLLRADVALYNRISDDMLCAVGQWSTPPDYKPMDRPEGHICYDVIQRAQEGPLVVRNLQESSYAETDPNVRAFGLQTYLGYAVRFGADYVGSLCVVFRRDFDPNESDLRLMGAIASAIGIEEERRLAQEALSESEERLRRHYEAIAAGVMVIAADGTIVRMNRAAEEILGIGNEQVLGKTLQEAYAEVVTEDGAPFSDEERPAVKVLRTSQPVHDVIMGVRLHSGRFRWLLVNSEPILDPVTGRLKEAVNAFLDVTDRKQAEEALEDERNFASAVLDTIGALVVVLDREGRIVRFNRACEEATGYTFDEVRGRPFFEFLLVPEEVEPVRSVFADLKAGNFPSRYENYWVAKDGTRRLIAWSNTVLVDDRGEPDYIIGTGIDVTDRRRAEQALRLAQFSVEHASDAAFWIGPDGRFLYVNEAACRALGYSCEELLTMSVPDIDPDFPRERWPEHWERTKQLGHTTFESRHRTKDGRVFPVDVSVSYLQYGGMEYHFSFARDITSRKAAEEALSKAEEQRRAFERRIELQKRRFYRETILSVTDGKLDICEAPDVRPYIANAELRVSVADVSQVSAARRQAEDFCRSKGLIGDRLTSFITGVGEAITNAIKHAGSGKLYAGSTEGAVWVGVADKGPGIGSLILPRATLLRGFSTKPSLGLGYSIMLEVSDHILLKTGDRGTTVILEKNILEPEIRISEAALPDTWENIPGLG